MNVNFANTINAIVLIIMADWAYLSADVPHFMMLIPAIVGFILIFCNRGIKRDDKMIAHIAVLLTCLMLLSGLWYVVQGLRLGDMLMVLRNGAMSGTSILAMVYFIKSFRDARRARDIK
ncbi:MAG: hypothetical protein AAF429_08735 [Pseudomonadota bacterium]